MIPLITEEIAINPAFRNSITFKGTPEVKKLLTTSAVVIVGLSLAACSSKPSSEAASSTTASGEKFTVTTTAAAASSTAKIEDSITDGDDSSYVGLVDDNPELVGPLEIVEEAFTQQELINAGNLVLMGLNAIHLRDYNTLCAHTAFTVEGQLISPMWGSQLETCIEISRSFHEGDGWDVMNLVTPGDIKLADNGDGTALVYLGEDSEQVPIQIIKANNGLLYINDF